ncbi:hypothetical protein TNCV_4042391 [Trichonephila clavipes]|nr:hypothetical protein TNCV_4042391 [Trichonephila clavipes]
MPHADPVVCPRVLDITSRSHSKEFRTVCWLPSHVKSWQRASGQRNRVGDDAPAATYPPESTTSQILLPDPPSNQSTPQIILPDPPVVETLEPTLTDDSSIDQIMSSVFGDYSHQGIPSAHSQEPQVLDTVPSLFDESNDLNLVFGSF